MSIAADEDRLYFPATERNQDAILDVLAPWLANVKQALEVASGSGQHVAHWAPRFPHVTWIPSDLDPSHRRSIAAWTANMENVAAPLELDATAASWAETGPVDLVFCANMIHIAPWEACLGLLARGAEVLAPGGALILYGPFTEDGRHNAESNAQFDASLRSRDPSWGIRDLNEVMAIAADHDLVFDTKTAMPANNFTVVFQRALSTR